MAEPVERDVTMHDGRTLGTAVLGARDGFPVVWHHGNPGGRVHPVSEGVLKAVGIRLLTYDRPGGGRSTPSPSRTVAVAADDIARLADVWQFDRFGTAGISGGGAFTLATAALLPERVIAAAVLSGAAPIDAEGLDFTSGMSETNSRAADDGGGGSDRSQALEEMEPIRLAILADPKVALLRFAEEFPRADRDVLLGSPEILASIADGMAECVRRSAEGWLDDSIAFARPWGFDVSRISVPVGIWHGRQDTAAPIAHARWLADRIAGAELHELEGGHYAPYVRLPEILRWLASHA